MAGHFYDVFSDTSIYIFGKYFDENFIHNPNNKLSLSVLEIYVL